MEALHKLRGRVPGLTRQDFLTQLRSPVLVARAIVSGDLSRKQAVSRGRRRALVASTHVHMGAMPEAIIEEAELATSEETFVRDLATPMWTPIRKGSHTAGGEAITLGRGAECDILLNDYTISKVHAAFSLETLESFWVTDLGSTNGSFVEGEPLPPQVATLVHSGQVVRFGRLVFDLLTPHDFWGALGETPRETANGSRSIGGAARQTRP